MGLGDSAVLLRESVGQPTVVLALVDAVAHYAAKPELRQEERPVSDSGAGVWASARAKDWSRPEGCADFSPLLRPGLLDLPPPRC